MDEQELDQAITTFAECVSEGWWDAVQAWAEVAFMLKERA